MVINYKMLLQFKELFILQEKKVKQNHMKQKMWIVICNLVLEMLQSSDTKENGFKKKIIKNKII